MYTEYVESQNTLSLSKTEHVIV